MPNYVQNIFRLKGEENRIKDLLEAVSRPKETLNGRKCLGYCAVVNNCTYAKKLKETVTKVA